MSSIEEIASTSRAFHVYHKTETRKLTNRLEKSQPKKAMKAKELALVSVRAKSESGGRNFWITTLASTANVSMYQNGEISITSMPNCAFTIQLRFLHRPPSRLTFGATSMKRATI